MLPLLRRWSVTVPTPSSRRGPPLLPTQSLIRTQILLIYRRTRANLVGPLLARLWRGHASVLLRIVCSRASVSGTASVFFSLQLLGVTGVLVNVVVRGHVWAGFNGSIFGC